jgi:hypothetical protein
MTSSRSTTSPVGTATQDNLYGPGTYFEGELPPAPHVQIDTAAAQTLEALDAASGILTVVDN